MNVRRTLLVLTLHLLLLPVLWAQEQRTVNGRKFTVHRVEAGQTLFAIARANAVPVDALLAANPNAQDGLSIGDELLIPLDAVQKKEARSAPVLSATGGLQHTVQKKETLYGIARNYALDINALLAANPQAQQGLQEGMVLQIPVSEAQGQQELTVRPAEALNIIEHTVQQGETLFSLGQRYGTTPEAIQRANDGLPEGLRTGMVLRVPAKPGMLAPPPVAIETPRISERHQVAFLLPFSVSRNDSALAASANDPQFHEATRIAAQFYGGALMALDSLRARGLQADVEVMDTGESPAVWGPVLKRPELQDVELFIGPFHRSAIEQLARANTRAHIVCPVPQTNKVILGMPNVSKVAPTRSDLLKHAARYVAQRHARENIIHLRPDIAADKDGQEQMGRALNASLGTVSARYRDTVLVARPGRRDISDLVSKLDAKRLNVIVTSCEDVEFVTSLVGKLKPLSGKFSIALVGTEAWLGLESIAVSDLDVLGFHFAAASFADPADARNKAFIRGFQERFHTDVDEYAYLGYDVTYHYLRALMEGSGELSTRLDQVAEAPLHMGFRMARTGPENGYRNEYAVMLLQKDLQLVKAP
jgi:LysM repeat protein